MFTFVITLIIIISLLLVLVILAQNSKGGGLSSQFGGASSSQVMGVKKTGDILEKITWGLAISLLVLSVVTNTILTSESNQEGFRSPNIDRASEQNITPNFGGDQEQPIQEGTEDASQEDFQLPEEEEN